MQIDARNLRALAYAAHLTQKEDAAVHTETIRISEAEGKIYVGGVTIEIAAIPRLIGIQAMLDLELSIWKAFHSIDPGLSHYCDIISNCATKGRSGPRANRATAAIEQMQREIGLHYGSMSAQLPPDTVNPTFSQLADRLINTGYEPLLRTILNRATGPIEDAINRLIGVHYDDLDLWRKDLSQVMTSLPTIFAIDNIDHPELKRYIELRSVATSEALQFTRALLLATRYLRLDREPPEPNPIAKLDERVLQDIGRWLNRDSGCRQVVVQANRVILAALDLIRATQAA